MVLGQGGWRVGLGQEVQEGQKCDSRLVRSSHSLNPPAASSSLTLNSHARTMLVRSTTRSKLFSQLVGSCSDDDHARCATYKCA